MSPASSSEIVRLTETFCAHNYHPLHVVLHEGKGVWLKDLENRRYLDMLSAYGAMNLGHGNKRLVAAARRQLSRMTLTSRAFYNDLLGPLARELTDLLQMDMMLPMVTGAEAVETALKACRRWGYEIKKIPDNKAEVICFSGNFAGRTTTILSFSDNDQYRRSFGPFTPGFEVVPFGDIKALEAVICPNTAAIFIEPIQGEGGINVPPDGFLQDLRLLCDRENILLVTDEVQCGLCRTGKLLACDHEGVKADLVIIGKSLGGGISPLSAVLGKREVLELFEPGSHGSTFGGNSLACAVALEVVKLIREEKPEENARIQGEYLMSELRALNRPEIKEVRGKGLMIGVELHSDAGAAIEYCEKLRELGVLCKDTRKQVMRLTPPLIITEKEIDFAVKRIKKAMTSRRRRSAAAGESNS